MDRGWVEATFEAIGRFGKGERGFNRLVFSDADWAACDHFAALMRQAGLAVRTDAWGNLIGRLDGTEPSAPAVATGSHLDTVPEGGNYDGGVGSVAGLGALMRLKARGRFRHPLELIVFRGEESSRFGIHTMGSKAMSGMATVAAWQRLTDQTGIPLAQVLAGRGLDLARLPEAVRRPGELKAFVEVHIEQCFVLEQAGIPIGVVEAIAAPIRLKITVEGVASHSGATPMGKRRDALVTASHLVLAVEAEAKKRTERRIVGTVGILKIAPGALNVVPGRAELWVDVRGIDEASLCRDGRGHRGGGQADRGERGDASSGGDRLGRHPRSDGSHGHRDDRGRLPPTGIRLPAHAQRRGARRHEHGADRAGRDDLHPVPRRDQPQPRRVRLARRHRAGHGCAHGDARRVGEQ